MARTDPSNFRLTVLSPGGRDREQCFPDGAGEPISSDHPPTNFHAYAACTRGCFERETKRTIGHDTPVLLLLRSDFSASERALAALQQKGRLVAVSLKETGLHQIAEQLANPARLARFHRLVSQADGCIAPTPEAADLYRTIQSNAERVAFIPTPYPIEDQRWNFSRPISERSGIFIGTREWNVLSRNHLGALLLARRLGQESNESVTVFNLDGRKGARLLGELGFPERQLRVLERRLPYPDYLREVARHKIVLQLDTSFVPGQVAGDALLCRVPCVGGNGAIDCLAFPDSCGLARFISEIERIALRLLTDGEFYRETVTRIGNTASVSFAGVAEDLRQFFERLSR